jgi:hypothetical protein
MKILNFSARLPLLALAAGLATSLVAADAAPAAKSPAPAPAAASPTPAAPRTASVAGKWTAAIDTQMGVQNYTYEFKMEGRRLAGTADSEFYGTKVEVTQTNIEGTRITFVETRDSNGMDLAITYTGELKGDEIAFKREVGEFATEEFVAKRVKPEAAAETAAPKKN